jgi:hypothetical protein
MIATFVLAVATKDRAQCRTLLARLVALGSLLAEHPELQPEAPAAPAAHDAKRGRCDRAALR